MRAIDESEHRRLFDLTALRAVVEHNPGRRGARLLELAEGPPERTRTELERSFLTLIERHGLPRPLVGARPA